MASRLELQAKLEELLGSENVYYQPPASMKMDYPAIRYSRDTIESTFANNAAYMRHNSYQIIVIDKLPDNPVIDKLLALPCCTFVDHYVADNLNHDILKLYF